jgi:hypothetical protein
MATRRQRVAPVMPRVEPISGSTDAGPAPGSRQIVEDPGQRNRGIADSEGRRQDRSAHHAGVAQAAQVGGAPVRNKVTPARY